MSIQVDQEVSVQSQARLKWAKEWLQSEKGNFVGGSFIEARSKGRSDSTNPANGELLGRFAEAGAEDVDLAVQSARQAFADREWRRMPRRERRQKLEQIAEAIRRHHEELATLESLDNGKLYREAFNDDVPEAWQVFQYYGGWTDKYYGDNCPVDDGFINYTVREPLGVCGLIVPWNFSLLLAAWKIAPALAMGNTVVVKPSPFTPFSLIRLCEILETEVDLPKGVINLVTGGAQTGRLICAHAGINKVSFTGSTVTGKQVLEGAARSNLKAISLELGGKSPNIVFEDVADLEFAIRRSFEAMFSHKGEKCSEPTRLIVHNSIYNEFLKGLAKLAEATICGDPFAERSTQGAQCNAEQFKKIMSYIEAGKQSGARLIAGGEQDKSGSNSGGYFVRPTIFADVDNRSAVAQDEIFGPVLVVMPFSTEEEAIALANDTSYGLAAGLWTKDVSRAHRVAAELEAGMVFINRYGCYDFSSPFGGFKQSGWGKEMAIHSLESYTRLKSVWLKL